MTVDHKTTGNKQPANFARPWTAEEDELLRSISQTGESRKELAELLGRSIHAVIQRANGMGLFSPNANQAALARAAAAAAKRAKADSKKRRRNDGKASGQHYDLSVLPERFIW